MDPMFDIPKNRPPLKVGRVCLLLGLTLILFMMVFHGHGHWPG